MVLADLPLWFIRTFGLVLGLLWGSFLNVVIYRLPREMSVSRPASHCPGCKKPIPAYRNIPVISYLLQRGQASCCGAKMSPRYVAVELIGGALSLAIVEVIVRALPASASLAQVGAVFGAHFFVCLALVAAAFIDLEHMYIPDGINYAGALLGVATATVRGYSISESLIGAVVGFSVVWLLFGVIYRIVRGKTGMGLGDAKLLMLVGAWTAWQGALFGLFGGAICATIFAFVLKAFGKELELPQAVKEDLEQLRAAALAGDEEARKALEEDPLLETGGSGPFWELVMSIAGFLRLNKLKAVAARKLATLQEEARAELEAAASEPDSSPSGAGPAKGGEEAPFMGRRLPFGPFIILAFFAYTFGFANTVRALLSLEAPLE